MHKSNSHTKAYAFQGLLGIGTGSIFTGTQVPVQASVTHVDDTGLAVGMLVCFRLIGALIGLAISSTAFNSVFAADIASLFPLPEQLKILEDESQAIGFIAMLRSVLVDKVVLNEVVEVYTSAFRVVWIV